MLVENGEACFEDSIRLRRWREFKPETGLMFSSLHHLPHP
jgi:hypothetical protein